MMGSQPVLALPTAKAATSKAAPVRMYPSFWRQNLGSAQVSSSTVLNFPGREACLPPDSAGFTSLRTDRWVACLAHNSPVRLPGPVPPGQCAAAAGPQAGAFPGDIVFVVFALMQSGEEELHGQCLCAPSPWNCKQGAASVQGMATSHPCTHPGL